MKLSWATFRAACKSSLAALAASLYYSRRRWKERCRRLRQQFGRAAKEIIALKGRVEWLEARLEADQQPVLRQGTGEALTGEGLGGRKRTERGERENRGDRDDRRETATRA